ncbi:MAG: alkaline phosphatase family protein [Actinobacteria bacterium]|nr:alkaline phosphatase family protein [Actinomycetota bacterium]
MHLSQVTPSIFSSLGLDSAVDHLAVGPSPKGRELLFLIDGFGFDTFEKYAEIMPTMSRMFNHGLIHTAFPSTTATSLATLTTGVMPGAHGMLGYTVQVPRSGGRLLNALKWDERVDPENWQPVETLFQRASNAGITVTHVAAKRYENSGFTRAVFRGAHYKGANVVADLIGETKAALQATPSFVYLYVNDLDSAGHSDGVGSDKWIAALSMIDQMVSQLMKEVPTGTRFWVTSDHGMVNAEEKVIIGQDNPLLKGVSVVAGEPRARHIYLQNDSLTARAEAASLWQEYLRDKALVLTREEALSSNLFGTEVSADAVDRMGEIIAIARGGLVLLDADRADKEGAMVGHHGGDSDIESQVGLLTTTLS